MGCGQISNNKQNSQHQNTHIMIPSLLHKVKMIQLPPCSRGSEHQTLEFVCTDHNCSFEDQLKLYCKKCVKAMVPTHQHGSIIQVLEELSDQLEEQSTHDIANTTGKSFNYIEKPSNDRVGSLDSLGYLKQSVPLFKEDDVEDELQKFLTQIKEVELKFQQLMQQIK